MFTSCPQCSRQYRIHARQLGAAQGMARCGHCGKKFNALERLTDIPIHLEEQLEVDENMELSAATSAYVDDGYEPQFDIPEILDTEEPEPASLLSRVVWSFAIVLMLVTIGAQLAWFNRDYLLTRYPEIKPWARLLCERVDCELIRHYSTSEIQLINRDVRLHPQYEDTLLVNATISNRSGKVQPYPRIQLALFDTNGKIIASRKFKPEEYLDNSIKIEDGMPVEQPVHFVLEVTGPTRSAVSFEFRFL